MKTFKTYLKFLLLSLTIQTQAQNPNDALVTINDSIYHVSDFERLYNKNIDIIVDETQKDIDNYFNLYKLYKIKLQKAYDLKIDQTDKLKLELKNFRKELSEKYFINENELNNLLNEAIDRSKYEVNASHILIAVNEFALPADTLTAYNKTIAIRNEILNGLNFEEAAVKYSEDLSVKSNNGNLGYFTVFRMVYPFETGAYNTKVGEISMPIRTNFGYHLIKVNNKRNTPKAKQIAHILIETKDKNGDDAKKKIDELYQRLQLGDPFYDVAFHFSEDISTRDNGGDLGMYNEGNLNINGISDILYELNFEGAYSKPFLSQHGWHIVSVTKIKELPTNDELKNLFIQRIKSDARSKVLEKDLLTHLKEMYHFKTYDENISKTVKMLNREDMFLTPIVESNQQTEIALATFADKKISAKNILEHIYSFPNKYASLKTDDLVILNALNTYSLQQLKSEYDKNLENNFPDFAATMREYKEGLMLFDLLEEEIWKKTANDTLALQNYYEANKQNYLQPNHFIGEVFVFRKKSDAKTYHKLLKNRIEVKEDDFPMVYKYQGRFNLDDKRLPTDLNIEKIGSKVEKHNNLFYVFNVRERKLAYIPTYNEIKSRVLSDYQSQFEKDYNDHLLNSAAIDINQTVLNQLKTKYNKKNHNKN